MEKFIVLHLRENSPIIFNLRNIVNIQQELNFRTKEMETIIITTEISSDDLMYKVIEPIEEVLDKIRILSDEKANLCIC